MIVVINDDALTCPNASLIFSHELDFIVQGVDFVKGGEFSLDCVGCTWLFVGEGFGFSWSINCGNYLILCIVKFSLILSFEF